MVYFVHIRFFKLVTMLSLRFGKSFQEQSFTFLLSFSTPFFQILTQSARVYTVYVPGSLRFLKAVDWIVLTRVKHTLHIQPFQVQNLH